MHSFKSQYSAKCAEETTERKGYDMSASREKKQRQKALQQTLSDSRSKEAKEARKEKRKWHAIVAVFIIIIILFIAMVVWKSNVIQKNMKAVSIGDEKYVAMDAEYYYNSAYNQISAQYGDYWNYLVDPSVPMDKQFYNDTQTWRDYFIENGVKMMQEAAIMSDAAKEAGYTMSDEAQTYLDNYSDQVDEVCTNYGITRRQYFSYYGAGMTERGFMRNLSTQILASDYASHLRDSYTYTDADYEAYYAEHSNDIDFVDYTYYVVTANMPAAPVDEETGDPLTLTEEEQAALDAEKAAAVEAAHAAAWEMAGRLSGGRSFDALVAEYSGDPEATATVISGYGYSSAAYAPDTSVADWVFDSARTPGEVGVIETDTGAYVVRFDSRYLRDDSTVNVRHILIAPEPVEGEDADGSLAAAAMANAKAEAERIYAEWQSGEATEESFAALAKEYSTDTGSAASGGLYENVYQGQMVETFNDWCFDPGRQPGDSGIVETQYGYHIMYFVSQGDAYWKYQCDNGLRSQEYSDWFTAKQAEYPISEYGPGMKLVGRT